MGMKEVSIVNNNIILNEGKMINVIIIFFFIELFSLHNIDYWSGRLYTTSSLKNLYGNYSLLIRAQDGGDPQKSSLATVNICVIDVNDNAPRFVSPPYNVTVRLLQVRFATVYTL